jgi:hypothetical protein
MSDTIKTGTILIAESAVLPDSMQLESEPFVYGWRLLKKLDSGGLDKLIGAAGWNFFYIAGVVAARVFGSDENKTTRKAIKHLLASPEAKNFNCLEITKLVAKRSMGIPYVSVSAHLRHIQESRLLDEAALLQS